MARQFLNTNSMYHLIICLTLILSTATFASTCANVYIISGDRKIDLFPDLPFYTQQMKSSTLIKKVI